MQSKRLSRVFSNTTVQKHQFFRSRRGKAGRNMSGPHIRGDEGRGMVVLRVRAPRRRAWCGWKGRLGDEPSVPRTPQSLHIQWK